MSREYVHGLKDALAVARERTACKVALTAAEIAIQTLIQAEERLQEIATMNGGASRSYSDRQHIDH